MYFRLCIFIRSDAIAASDNAGQKKQNKAAMRCYGNCFSADTVPTLLAVQGLPPIKLLLVKGIIDERRVGDKYLPYHLRNYLAYRCVSVVEVYLKCLYKHELIATM